MAADGARYFQFVLAPQIVIGLDFGVAVILVALGLTIIFGLLDVINMSHGEFYAFGAFIGVTLASFGLPFWLLLILVPALMLPIGYFVERLLIQRVFIRPTARDHAAANLRARSCDGGCVPA